MNLCLNTKIARETKFDEKQEVDVETDFGYRLTKKGKMAYMPKAKVFHYHRADLKSYFKQQKEYAKWALRLLFNHGKKAVADHITTPSMVIQIPILSLGLFFLVCSLFSLKFIYLAFFALLVLLAIYIKNILEINTGIRYYPGFMVIFLVRNIAWIFGIAEGAIFFLFLFFHKRQAD
jgi:hypothetical protein